MTKRITLLLVAIFSWLFIGSLIMFHQEQVLGKHSSALSHLFIVPKSKEKVNYHLKHITSSQKDHFSGFLASSGQFPVYRAGHCEKVAVTREGSCPALPDKMICSLRAPPAA